MLRNKAIEGEFLKMLRTDMMGERRGKTFLEETLHNVHTFRYAVVLCTP